jgi:hypothetical protein
VTPEDIDHPQVADETSAVAPYQGTEYQHLEKYDSPSAKLKLQVIGERRMLRYVLTRIQSKVFLQSK